MKKIYQSPRTLSQELKTNNLLAGSLRTGEEYKSDAYEARSKENSWEED